MEIREQIIRIQESLFLSISIVILAVLSAILLLFEIIWPDLAEPHIALLHRIDLLIAYIFLTDFAIGLFLAKNRKRYVQENWLNLASSIPVSNEVFRALRILRVIRVVRIIRAFRITRAAMNIRQAMKRSHRN